MKFIEVTIILSVIEILLITATIRKRRTVSSAISITFLVIALITYILASPLMNHPYTCPIGEDCQDTSGFIYIGFLFFYVISFLVSIISLGLNYLFNSNVNQRNTHID